MAHNWRVAGVSAPSGPQMLQNVSASVQVQHETAGHSFGMWILSQLAHKREAKRKGIELI